MRETKEATVTVAQNTLQTTVYHTQAERQEKIAERRAGIPKKYRNTYDRAVSGKSLRACVNAFCLECICWQSREVTLCTDLACPLWAVRPYRGAGNAHRRHLRSAGSTNTAKLDIG
jgi:hypothetical protein